MNQAGPALETLLRRLAETPADFLALSHISSPGIIPVAAVLSDLLRSLGDQSLTQIQALQFQVSGVTHVNRLSLCLLACWLLNDDWFHQNLKVHQPYDITAPVMQLMTGSLSELASITTSADQFVSDPDRREELARLCLMGLGLLPAGESLAQAQDRLNTISTAERQRVIGAARQAEERTRLIRAEMMRKAKAEADSKAMRE
jgi:hypothetical protein